MDTVLPDVLPLPQRGDGKREIKIGNTMSLFSVKQFKYPVGVVLNISGEVVIIWQAF